MTQIADAWIDETGGKGFHRNLKEDMDEEFALLVAILINRTEATHAKTCLQSAYDIFVAAKPIGEKTHITDAYASQDATWIAAANKARKKIFRTFKFFNGHIIYAAKRFGIARIEHEQHQEYIKNLKRLAKERHPEMTSNQRASDSRIEADAFQTLTLLFDCYGKDFDVEIVPISDRTDDAIAAKYMEKLNKARSVSSSNLTSKHFNITTRETVTSKYNVGSSVEGWAAGDIDITQVRDINISQDVGPELFAVDVIANSLRFHLRTLSKDQSLHGPEAIIGWDGAEYVWGTNVEGLWLD